MLKLYRTENADDIIDATDLNAILIGIDKDNQESKVVKVFLRNDDPSTWLSDIVISLSTTGLNILDGSNNVGFKLLFSKKKPSERMWNRIAYGQSLRIGAIGQQGQSDNDFHPLWIKVDNGETIDIGVYSIDITADYVEHNA